ncbi:hypothetical protein [Noviherbaspirillum sp.]|uniref:hypothetical protein n=1 Tax=Noviherbaspirillum sp. TaxID=1926288 RepID=UPI002D63B764|nr:hypothetical protein [Noviherbaspirillum sp.]HZW20766.1 hypothetical protein [Noviherbaspirillum sp.]
MNTKRNDFVARCGVFIRIALATGLLLLIPLAAMQFTSEVNWDMTDFIVMGFLLFGTGSTFVLVSRKAPRNYRLAIGAAFTLALLYVWAELAAGVFTNLGS